VADENTKLRNLLAQIGIKDDAVVAYLQNPPTSDNLIGVVAAQTIEQPHQKCKSSYLEGNIDMPANSTTGGPGSLDPSTYFSTVNLGVYLPADSEPLPFSLSGTYEQGGLIELPVLDTLRYRGWNE
jgi:hypothetical protein